MTTFYRKEQAIWDLIALVGGFSVAAYFVTRIAFQFVTMNG